MADNDVFERFTRREERLRIKEHSLFKALTECSLDAYRIGSIRPSSLAAFDVSLAELRSWLDDLSQDIHEEPILDEHSLHEE
jgi:hypothetical protein